jgi:UTP--glucose-1-phosphate uridylyltransferase
MKITKAVVPAAGHGTRFLPWTKAVPKELLPLFNKPAIHYIAQEIADAGLTECIMISAPHKHALENYFKPAPELEKFLQEKSKSYLLSDIDSLIQSLRFTYVYQEEAKGLGHAINLARNSIADDYFGILLPDDIMVSNPSAIKQLIDIAHTENASVVAVQEVPREKVSSYGIIAIKNQIHSNLFEVSDLVEKPAPHDAPSNLAIIGRYVLSRNIFTSLEHLQPSAGGEIQLTDGIAHMLKSGKRVLACTMHGSRFDVGTPAGWLEANLALAQKQH